MPSLTIASSLSTALTGITTVSGLIAVLNPALANGSIRWRKSGTLKGSNSFTATPCSENNGEIVVAWNNGARSDGTTNEDVNSATWTFELCSSAGTILIGSHAAYANDETLPNYLTTPFGVLSKTWRTAGQVIFAGSMRLNPNLPEPVLNATTPHRYVIEDWSTGSAVAVTGEVRMMKSLGSNRHLDADLFAAMGTWQEFGPSSLASLPELRGIRFSGKRLTMPAGGVWTQESHEVMILAIPTDAQYNGIIGDMKNVRTVLKDYKARILNQQGATLALVQMEKSRVFDPKSNC